LAPNFAQPLPFCSSPITRKLLAETISCNCTGTHNDSVASEKAMLKFIKRCGVEYEDVRRQYLPKDLIRFVFDPVRKRMSTIVELGSGDSSETGYNKRVHVKGASEIVLECCEFYLDE
jgi:magnesium-transporting ATPase (P-type)